MCSSFHVKAKICSNSITLWKIFLLVSCFLSSISQKKSLYRLPCFALLEKMAQISPKFFIPESFQVSREDIAGQFGLIWELLKAPLIVPLLKLGVYICLAMSLMLFMERVYMGIVIILVKLFWPKPEKRYNWQPIEDDVELGSSNFPVVLIQIPMFNEKEVSVSLLFSLLFNLLCFCFLVSFISASNTSFFAFFFYL